MTSLALVCVVIVVMVLIIKHPGSQDQNNVEVVKKEVARHILLPTNEQPALATIVDKNKVNHTLFKNVQDGDKVLIYQKNQKYIVYRPSIDRIVDVGPVTINPINQ